MGQVIDMRDGRPWSGSEAGERAWRVEVSRKVARWRRRRALERRAWVLPAAVVAVVLFAVRALAWGRAWPLAVSAAALAGAIALLLRRAVAGR
jgi:hypothetical protein